jgi:5-methylcytosine-specific restriction endonuclease McrA
MAYVPEPIKRAVFKRANYRCEYCLINEKLSFFSFHIEHIISLKHGGKTELNNLALACPICNINKGTDIATVLPESVRPIRFFNPRSEKWSEHFNLESSGLIVPITQTGEATIKILNLNHPDSIIERKEMLIRGIVN